MNLQRCIGAHEVLAIVEGYRAKKFNAQRTFKHLTGKGGPEIDLEVLAPVIEESHARVPPEVRARQMEEKRLALASVANGN